MTPQLQALTLAFVLMLIYFGYVVRKTDKKWREEMEEKENDI